MTHDEALIEAKDDLAKDYITLLADVTQEIVREPKEGRGAIENIAHAFKRMAAMNAIASTHNDESSRRIELACVRIEESSKRVETLNRWLIVYTFVLTFATMLLAIHDLRH